METQSSRFIIERDDLEVDPVTLVTDGLKIGRLPSCEVVLNHPAVSRLHAGITMSGGHHYLYNFSSSSGTTLNGRVVATESGEVLADGDLVQIGPFFLEVKRVADRPLALQEAADGHLRAVAGAQRLLGEAQARGRQDAARLAAQTAEADARARQGPLQLDADARPRPPLDLLHLRLGH